MRRIRSFFLVQVLLITGAFGQGSDQDSLLDRLARTSGGPGRIDLLIELSMRRYESGADTSGLVFLREAVARSRPLNYAKGLAFEPVVRAILLHHQGDHRAAISAFKESIALLDRAHVPQGFLSPLNLMRYSFTAGGWQQERKAYYEEALRRYERDGPHENTASCFHALGGYYLVNQQYALAIENYTRAREVFQEFEPESAVSEDNVIGLAYASWGNIDRAIPLLTANLKRSIAKGELNSVLAVYMSLGDLSLAAGDTLQALNYFEQAKPYWSEVSPVWVGPTKARLVQTLIWTHHLDDAARELAELHALSDSVDLPISWASGVCELDYADHLYANAIGSTARADSCLGRALAKARTAGDLRLVQKYRRVLAARYRDRGDMVSAAALSADYIQTSDSLRALGDRIAVTAYEGELARRRDLIEIERKNAQLARQRLLMMSAGIFIALLGVSIFLILRSNRQKQRANRELEAARQRAEQSEKFKQQFLANMSHEIRTPMNAIMGMSGILKRNAHTPEQEKYLSAIAQSSENLLVILNDILDLSKLEAGKIELEKVPFAPRQVISNVRDIIRFKAEEKGLSVEFSIADEVPPALLGDPTRLNQIVLNLAGNAVKFTEKGGVMIRVSAPDKQDARCTLVVDVVDTGIGIPQDRLDRIFEEFTQAYSDTTRKYGGTGLGLTISKRLAELQGGGITVSSEQGRGSTFTVRIPYTIASSDSPGSSTKRQSPPSELRDLRILLAEDNDFNAMVAQDELADAIPGVQVDVAANGRIAVEMAQANAYDVILMDVQMPEMNGYDASRTIKALGGDRSRIPIIAMTANVMKEELERCKGAGMDGCVPKPFKREELMGAISTALARDHVQ